jgi:hypothetical protein
MAGTPVLARDGRGLRDYPSTTLRVVPLPNCVGEA